MCFPRVFACFRNCGSLLLINQHYDEAITQIILLPDLEWKIIYVGSAESEEYDQVLDSVLVGPVPAGRHMFVFQVSKLQ